MKINRDIPVCDNCGYETLKHHEIATVSMAFDGHVQYEVDLCRIDDDGCLAKLVELGQRGRSVAVNQEPTAPPRDNGKQTGTVCSTCGQKFKTPAALKAHITRKHA